jgi:VCBS repeat-containing protein
MASQAHALGVAGQQQNVSITLKKRSGASYASAGHLTFATTLARVSCQQLSGAHEGEVMADIRVTTAHDGTNHPITMTVSI